MSTAVYFHCIPLKIAFKISASHTTVIQSKTRKDERGDKKKDHMYSRATGKEKKTRYIFERC